MAWGPRYEQHYSRKHTVTQLRQLFAAYGLPESVVLDNRPQFTSEEFETFLKLNCVKHVLCPPYHPASDGLAEKNVQTLKGRPSNSSATSGFLHSVSIQKHTSQHHRPYSCWTISDEGSPNKVNHANQDSWQTTERKTSSWWFTARTSLTVWKSGTCGEAGKSEFLELWPKYLDHSRT